MEASAPTAPSPAASAPEAAAPAQALRGLIEMTKPRLSSLVVLTTAVGFFLAGPAIADLDWGLLVAALLGTSLSAFGANALNQVIELPYDRHMPRTCDRPLPSGRVDRRLGLAWSLALLALGAVVLLAWVNPLTALLATGVGVVYVTCYTPLKRRSSTCTLVGAVTGAVPPLIGWAAVTGTLAPAAGVLFAILFIWQIPHFLAIDWCYRDDYARGGFYMLSRVDPSGRMTARQVVVYSLALVPVSLMATPLGLGGWLYPLGALALGLWFLGTGVVFYRRRTHAAARRVFIASLAYLPLLLLLLALDPTS